MTETGDRSIYTSPIGPLLLLAEGGRVTGLYMKDHAGGPAADGASPSDHPVLARLGDELDAYFAGRAAAFTVPLDLRGTPFQQRVWAELLRIPPGETISYGELARRIGNPAAVRAVGLANGRNPVSIIVPCHRVIGSNGRPVGYGGGIDRKLWLLDHETRHFGAGSLLPPLAVTPA